MKTKEDIHNEAWVRSKEDLVRFTFGLGEGEEGTMMGETSELLTWIERESPEAAAKIRTDIESGRVKIYTLQFDARGSSIGIFLASFNGGSDFPNHRHNKAHATIYITEGVGTAYLEGKEFAVKAGDTVNVPPGTAHEFFAESEGLTYIAVTHGVVHQNDETYDWVTVPTNRPD